jgi:hypothetical protein
MQEKWQFNYMYDHFKFNVSKTIVQSLGNVKLEVSEELIA